VGEEGSTVVQKVRAARQKDLGYWNAAMNVYGDMIAISHRFLPRPSFRRAPERRRAASLMLTTEAIIAERPKRELERCRVWSRAPRPRRVT
jgi:chaperonin GroEL (HSP60 family)